MNAAKGQILRLSKGRHAAAQALFLSRMTNIAAKTLVVCRQTLTFVEYHITKESFSSRELRRYTPRISNPHLISQGQRAHRLQRYSEKTDATPTRRILLSIHRLIPFFRT